MHGDPHHPLANPNEAFDAMSVFAGLLDDAHASLSPHELARFLERLQTMIEDVAARPKGAAVLSVSAY